MKKLLLIAMAIICCRHIQAEGWFANWWNQIKEGPYQQGSFRTYPPENVASRLAGLRYLGGNDIAEDQEKLIADYKKYLWDKSMRREAKNAYYAYAKNSAEYLANKPQPFRYSHYHQEAADYMDKKRDEGQKKWSKIFGWQEYFVPTIRQQEAEMLRPRTFYEYQHPDQYILNN